MLRVVHIVSFFLAGLSRAHQNVIWITDEDEIAANDNRMRELTNLFGNISSHYLPHSMGHFRCGTMKSDDGSRQLEDLASIPDLVAGAKRLVYIIEPVAGSSALSLERIRFYGSNDSDWL
jgi:hypothetical protein